MKRSVIGDMIMKAACLGGMVLVAACSDADFYTGDLSKQDLEGRWHLVEEEAEEGGEGYLEIETSGRFRAVNVPLRKEPRVFETVSDSGRWSLKENQSDRYRYRWKVEFIFEGVKKGVKFDVVPTAEGPGLLYRRGVDTFAGYHYRREE